MSETIKVVCRFRGGQQSEDKWFFDPNGLVCKSPAGARESKSFTFDRVLDSDSTQETAYNEAGKSTVQALLSGFNSTIFAYGQSGSGKTFTMLGPDEVVDAIKEGGDGVTVEVMKMYGIIPRAIGDIFEAINRIVGSEQSSVELSVQYLEIYNEKVKDLLTKSLNRDQDLKLREMPNGQMVVMGSEIKAVQSFDDIFLALMEGQRSRAVASTNQNDRSSRSHTIFVINFKQMNSDGSQKQGRLNLVDLAGSERISKTGATGKTLQEAQKINLSLTSLGLVIKALTENSAHIPFRDSKLTMFLKDALGGNSKTTLICTASKQLRHIEESVQTLQFAQRAKKIKNRAAANVMRSPKEMQMLIEKLKAEVSALKAQLIQNGLTPILVGAGGPKKQPEPPAADISQELVDAATSANTSTPSQPEESKDSIKDVSFNTLLDDSTLSFNPDAASAAQLIPVEPAVARKQSKAEKAQINDMKVQLTAVEERLLDVTTEYEHYQTKTQTEIIQLRDKFDTAQHQLDSQPNYEELLAQLREAEYRLSEKEDEIERIKDENKQALNKKDEEQAVKDLYIKDLETQNEDYQGELEKFGYETFIQIKKELFESDMENERLADRKKYVPLYESFQGETDLLMEKYTHQESTIQNLQNQNQELFRILQTYEEDSEHMEAAMSESAGTEMMGMQSDTMSMNSGFQGYKGKGSMLPQVVEEDPNDNLSDLQSPAPRKSKEEDGLPSMEDLIQESKSGVLNRERNDSFNKVDKSRDSLQLTEQKQQYRAGSFVNAGAHKRQHSQSIGYGGYNNNNNGGSAWDASSMASSVMVREVDNMTESKMSQSHMSVAQRVGPVVDNTRLSALTNRIMELVIDNIKLLHMDKKLLEYCKRMQVQSNQRVESLEEQLAQMAKQHESSIQSQASNAELAVEQAVEQANEQSVETSNQIGQMQSDFENLKAELEEMRAKNENLTKALENERLQYSRTIREKQYDMRSKVNEMSTQMRVEKQNIVRLEMEKQQLAKDLAELKEDLNKAKSNEKKLKAEMQDEKLKNSKTLQQAITISQQNQQSAQMHQGRGLGYQGYLARHSGGGAGAITGKVGMQSKFMDLNRMNTPGMGDGQTAGQIQAQRRASVLPNPLGFSSGRPKRQGLGLSNNVQEMLGAAGIKSDPAVLQELEEDCKPDYTAEAIDDLDQLANDLESSSGDEKDD